MERYLSMKKVISFCLYGNKLKYLFGAVKNSYLAKYVYTGWECWFYVSDCVPQPIIDMIRYNGGKIIECGPATATSMFWRFRPLFEEDVEIFISRDTDSRLNTRERYCVKEWESWSKKHFHTMHDHLYHQCSPILGGMWGCKVAELSRTNFIDPAKELMENKIREFEGRSEVGIYNLDQAFLCDLFQDAVSQGYSVLDHSSQDFVWGSFDHNDISEYLSRSQDEYIGAPYDENENLEIPYVGRSN
jgi:hypothetical protein